MECFEVCLNNVFFLSIVNPDETVTSLKTNENELEEQICYE